MEQIFRIIFSLSISGSLIGLLILLLRPITGRAFTKRWSYYLWLLVLVRLLVPIHGNLNLMEYLWTNVAAAYEMDDVVDYKGAGTEITTGSGYVQTSSEILSGEKNGTVDGLLSGEENGTVDGLLSGEGSGTAYAALPGRPEIESSGQTVSKMKILTLAGILWALGVCLMIFRQLFIYRRFVREIRAACRPVTDEKTLNKNREIQGRLGISRKIPLYESDTVDSPMLIGFWNPGIYLPSVLLAEMSGREYDICLILHHELIHYKRRDIWYKWLFQAALCVHWFNPLVYVFNRKFNMDCELACDEAVMTLLSEEGRRAYGNVLLDAAQKNLCDRGLSGKNTMLYKNIPTMTLLEEKRTLKERLQGIAHYHKKGMLIGLCSAAVLILFAAITVVCGAAGVRAGSRQTIPLSNRGDGANEIDSGAENAVLSPAEEEKGNFAARVWGQISDPFYSLGEPLRINKKTAAYRMYDDDALIAGESESDIWRATNYCGGENSVSVSKFALNGSDALWILYANRETTLELSSVFALRDGRFKIVLVRPDQTVQTLNESGEKTTVEITLLQGRNVIKMVGQEARLEDIDIACSGMQKEDFDGVYGDEDLEYAYQVLEGKKPVDPARLEEVCLYMKEEEVSVLAQRIWEEGVVLSEEEWEELFLYSDTELTAQYLVEALQKGNACGFNDRLLGRICYQVSTKSLTDIVMALDRDELSFEGLTEDVLPFVQKQDEAVTCICHYIDLGNVLTNDQIWEIEGYVSEDDFFQIIEYNRKRKQQGGVS